MKAFRAISGWLSLIVGGAIALFALNYALNNLVLKAEDLAFGTETASMFGGVDGKSIHCGDARDSAGCIASFRKGSRDKTVLWLGNSQLAGINRVKKGDENAPQKLHRLLDARGTYLVSYSQPNANLYEHALIYSAIAPVYKPDLLLLPVVFDDLREFGIRTSIADLTADPMARKSLERARYYPLLQPLLKSEITTNDPNLDGRRSPQVMVEDAMTGWLGRHWTLWQSRSNLRGTLGSAIHLMRNKILGIHSYTKRSVPSAVYAERMHFLDLALGRMRADGVQVLLYVPPFRDDIDGPYIASQYSAFKQDLIRLAKIHGALFADFELVVPGVEWGMVKDHIFGFKEPDFMHFTEQGHERFARALDVWLMGQGY